VHPVTIWPQLDSCYFLTASDAISRPNSHTTTEYAANEMADPTTVLDPATMDPADLALTVPMPSHDPSVTQTVISSIWVMASISTIFLWLRVYCRLSYARKLWWDDILLITGWALLIFPVGLKTRIFQLGYSVTLFGGPEIGPMNLASDTFMKLALAFGKTSFALTVLRIATGWTLYVIYFVAFVLNAAMLIHAVLVWRGNCGTPTPWTFEPCCSLDSGIT
jgi:hypothetical protein